MATIPANTFKVWRDGDVVNASDYMKELEILRVAINGNGTDLAVLKNAAQGILKGIQHGDDFPANPRIGDVFYRTDENLIYILSETEDWVGLAPNLAFTAHAEDTENPHKVSATQLGVYTKTETDEKFVTAEKGSNANGEYIKWSNGVMECWKTDVFASTSANAWTTVPIAGNTYYAMPGTWTFPAPFKNGSTVHVFASGDINGFAPETHKAHHTDHTKCSTELGAFGVDVRGFAVKRHLYARGVWK